jgi:hypothetical protein
VCLFIDDMLLYMQYTFDIYDTVVSVVSDSVCIMLCSRPLKLIRSHLRKVHVASSRTTANVQINTQLYTCLLWYLQRKLIR